MSAIAALVKLSNHAFRRYRGGRWNGTKAPDNPLRLVFMHATRLTGCNALAVSTIDSVDRRESSMGA
jgi:hypothetical protein